MPTILKRHATLGAALVTLVVAAIATLSALPPREAQAQPNPAMFAQQPPAACVCAAPVPVFGGSGGPVIAHCQCGALSCAAATAAGGVSLQCGR
jgi:hypothetical protein